LLSKHLFDGPLVSVDNLLKELQESRQTSLTSFLWKDIETQPNSVAERVWEMPLERVAHFIEVAKNHMDTEPLWKAIESKPDMIAAHAWRTSLGHVAHFMKVANSHKRDAKPLWDAILGKPGQPDQKTKLDRFAEQAWRTSLEQTSSFLKVAFQQGRDTKPLWEALEKDPDRLSRKGKDAALEELVALSNFAPRSLLEIALRNIQPGHWKSISPSEAMVGAALLAWKCSNKELRTDLVVDLITLLLRRANWKDFPSQDGGFAQVCWLLANVPSSAVELVEPFLEAVCNKKWLHIAYREESCEQLATGLKQLALYQPPELCRRFDYEGCLRLNEELARFETAGPKKQSEIIQFLGCAHLCGWPVSPGSLANIRPESIPQLRYITDEPEVARVRHAQFQVWLGLRAFVSTTRKTLPFTRNTIEETLKRWRVNLEEEASLPGTVAHRVNQSMIAWLEACLRAEPPALLPSQEPF
jgi:hypothetical protein